MKKKLTWVFVIVFILAIAVLCIYRYQADEKAQRKDLEDRFGDISLSEDEVSEYANWLVNGDG